MIESHWKGLEDSAVTSFPICWLRFAHKTSFCSGEGGQAPAMGWAVGPADLKLQIRFWLSTDFVTSNFISPYLIHYGFTKDTKRLFNLVVSRIVLVMGELLRHGNKASIFYQSWRRCDSPRKVGLDNAKVRGQIHEGNNSSQTVSFVGPCCHVPSRQNGIILHMGLCCHASMAWQT